MLEQGTPAPPATAPAPPGPQAPPPQATAPTAIPVVAGDLGSNPADVYQAFVHQRNELRSQQSELQDQRRSIANRLREGKVGGADKAGLEGRLTTLDQQISDLDKQIQGANLQVAKSAAVPGSIVPSPPDFERGPPESVVALSALFIISVFLPLSIAFARRIWRRGSPAAATPNPAATERMTRIEEAVEAIAVEVERVGEGQRYLTKLLASAPAEPLSLQQREQARESVKVR